MGTTRRLGLALAVIGSLALWGCAAETPEQVGGLDDSICCGVACCSIGGMCFTSGQRNPADMCQQCLPANSQVAFSPVPGCGGSDAGTPPRDAGGGSGGGCSASGFAPEHALMFGPFLLGLALVWRRRRA